MPSKSSGRIAKVHKNSTPHQKNHRFESFTNKIAKFNSLQPLRKVRRHDLDKEDDSAATSYFRTGLQKWGELNISKGFVSFKREVLSLSESLPQILHFEKRIFESLAKHIAMQDKEALEPLLDLLTAFAHDLGVRFEKHYPRSLGLIVDIAGRPQDADVIEWTFAALAFLFKYLSKLLVPNLTPTYGAVSPLMGKARHPPHIARFASEALSFLVKKAAGPSHRATSLPAFVAHVKSDLCDLAGDRQFTLYQDGVMTMFAEAIKGNDNVIHSAGPAIFVALLNAALDDNDNETDSSTATRNDIWTDVVCGVLTSVIHHSTTDTFTELQEAILETITSGLEKHASSDAGASRDWWALRPYIKVLGVMAGVRKGSRVSDWSRVSQSLANMLEIVSKCDDDVTQKDPGVVWRDVMVPTAITFHHAPLDAMLSPMAKVPGYLTTGPLMRWFIPFCSYFCDLDASRFGNMLRTEFLKFIAGHWSQGGNQDLLCVLIPGMIEKNGFEAPGKRGACRLPQGWQDQIVSKFENLEISPFPERGPYNKDPQVWRDECLPKYSALLRLLALTTVHPSTNARIAELLLRKLKLALRPSSTLASDEVHFIVSQGFHAYLRMSKPGNTVDTTLSPLLRAAVPRFARSVGFLKAYIAYEEHLQGLDGTKDHDDPSSDGSNLDEDPVIASLVENLCSPSHKIRLASLQLLKRMNGLGNNVDFVDNMIEIEQLPLTIDHVRTISMLLRNLGQKYPSLDDSTWLQKGVPSFVFGMLTVKLSPVWDNATEALEHMSQSKEGEEIISNLAFKWLAVPSPRWTPSVPDSANARRVLTNFDCTLLNSLQSRAEEVCNVMDTAIDIMLRNFDEQQRTPDALANNARTRALKVFNALPSMAERRSRRLVPHFLPWALEDDASLPDDVELDDSYWSLADRKALLRVFSQFINPRVLYLHEKVYDGLLSLMENGDIEFQKLTLKAILAWKQEGVKPYQENLEFLLDEARLKNELTVFLQGDTIKPEHRSELLPVLLRLLYGRTISKKGTASGKHGLHATRLTVLRNLSVEDMGAFLDIATGKLSGVKVIDTSASRDKLFAQPIIPPRKQVGFLNMASSLISELGTNVTPYMETLLNAVLYCVVFACRQLTETTSETADHAGSEDDENASSHSLHRITRSTGIKCLIMLFQNAQSYQWESYRAIIIQEVIAPRLENLPTEMTQGVSGILQLLSTWSALPNTALFLGPHEDVLPQGILPKVIECLAAEKAKDDVRIFILSMVRNLVRLAQAPAEESEFNELIQADLLDANADAMLENITAILRAPSTSNDLLEAGVEALLSLSEVLREPRCVESVLKICSFLLQQPPRRVSPKTKGRLLLVVESFVALVDTNKHRDLCDDVYDTLASLFSYFKDRENRQALCRALAAVADDESSTVDVPALCTGLNSYKEGRIDEPDYDRRLAAFNAMSDEREIPLTPREWLPLLHNCLFYIKVDEEFGVLATNSADGMRRFVRDVDSCQSESDKAAFEAQLTNIIIPAMHAGAREPSETTRREVLRVFGFILRTMPQWEPVKDMGGLLADTEEDSVDPPFFFNILSPAVSRQLEALQVLEKANVAQEIGSQNLAQFFIPLLEHFLFDRVDGSDDRGLGAQATTVIGELAKSLHWKHYRTTLQRYISYVASKPDHQKQTIRLLGKFTDALVASVEKKPVEAMEVDDDDDDNSGGASSTTVQRLSLTVPKQEQLATEIVNHFLPTLMKHLHEKDESEVSYRVPVGVTIVKLLRLLPSDDMKQRLAGVLTDICHILRSKAAESREMARDTLIQIAILLGSAYIGFILRELRGALTKGYQLHVLSYTVHAILVAVIPNFEPGDLDYCIPSIVNVIMDDIFGVIGQEKDAEGYISQMKEVKSSKSQDSMELVAKNASITRLIDLVQPLQSLLMQKVDLKMIRKVDNLLGRVSTGLLQNRAAESRDTLVFCYEVIQSVYRSREPEAPQKLDPRVRKYLVQKGAKKGDRGQTSRHMYKLLRFAFDTLRSMFKKHDSLRTPENLSGFIPLLGDAIIEGEDEVKMAAFRLLAVITKVPFPGDEGTNIYKVAVKEATKSVSTATSTTTDLSQAALKMLSVVLRDRKDVPIRDAAVDLLLGKLKDDLTEPQYRHVTFNFLRSVLERKVETATVYDTLDYAGTVMITNDDKETRDLARGAFFQFIREYPQKKARWDKQLEFIIANLKYDREGGRLSVLEMVHLLLMKSSDEFVQEVAASCFLPLFMVLANDDSEKCTLSAAELLKETFRRANKERTANFLDLLRKWLDNQNPAIVRLSLLLWSYYFECHDGADKNNKDFKLSFGKVMELLSSEDLNDTDGHLVEAALSLVTVLFNVLPEKILSSSNEELWTHIGRCMGHPHPPVKLAAIKLTSLYLADFAQNPEGGSQGPTLGQDKVEDLVRLALNVLNGHEVDEELAAEAGQILIFLGPQLPTPEAAVEEVHVDGAKAGEEAEDENEAEDEDEDGEGEGSKKTRKPKDLQYLFWRLSHILRKEIRPRAAAIVSKTVAMEVLETVCRRSSIERLTPCFKTILSPLHNLTDPTIRPPQTMDETFTARHEHVKTRAQILMDSLQKKFGTAEYSRQLLTIREEVRDKRQARAAKRKIEAIAQPEKYGRDKRKKLEKNKSRKKARSSEHKAKRQAYKNW